MINTIRCNYSNQNHKEGKIMGAKNCKRIGSHYLMGRVLILQDEESQVVVVIEHFCHI